MTSTYLSLLQTLRGTLSEIQTDVISAIAESTIADRGGGLTLLCIFVFLAIRLVSGVSATEVNLVVG